MDNLFSKASSYLNSQADQQGAFPNQEQQQYQKPASSGGYGELLAGAQSLMKGANGGDGTNNSTDGYKNLLAGAQALMGGAATQKPNSEGVPFDAEAHKNASSGYSASHNKEEDAHKNYASSGYGASIGKEEDEDARKIASSHGYGDLLANTQVMMKAGQANTEAEKAEVAGAAANLLGAAAQYGNLENTSYGEYVNKAQAYLHNYQASHGKPAPNQGAVHQSPSVTEGKEEGSTLVSEDPPTYNQSPPYTSSS